MYSPVPLIDFTLLINLITSATPKCLSSIYSWINPDSNETFPFTLTFPPDSSVMSSHRCFILKERWCFFLPFPSLCHPVHGLKWLGHYFIDSLLARISQILSFLCLFFYNNLRLTIKDTSLPIHITHCSKCGFLSAWSVNPGKETFIPAAHNLQIKHWFALSFASQCTRTHTTESWYAMYPVNFHRRLVRI